MCGIFLCMRNEGIGKTQDGVIPVFISDQVSVLCLHVENRDSVNIDCMCQFSAIRII